MPDPRAWYERDGQTPTFDLSTAEVFPLGAKFRSRREMTEMFRRIEQEMNELKRRQEIIGEAERKREEEVKRQ